jgi:RNA polymerase sigma-70 factor, ECF subfamily
MTYSVQSTKFRIGAVVNREIHSSRNQSVKRALVAREMEIMTAAQAGSTTAFDELQTLYSSRLFRTILRITKNREDAEDALQDTFLRAYLALHRFEARSSVYSWLTRIAINSALMILRRRRSRPEALLSSPVEEGDDYLPLEIKDSASNPEQLCDLRQRSKRLLHAIGKLDPRLRTPIEFQLAREYSLKQIADTLNISVAAVKARLYRARANLAKQILMHSRAKKHLPLCLAAGDVRAGAPIQEMRRVTCR